MGNVIDGLYQLKVVTQTKHFANGHHLPFSGAVRANTAGELNFSTQVVIQRHAFESRFGHRDQFFGQIQQFMGVAFTLAFTDVRRFIFDTGFVHAGFSLTEVKGHYTK